LINLRFQEKIRKLYIAYAGSTNTIIHITEKRYRSIHSCDLGYMKLNSDLRKKYLGSTCALMSV